MSALLKKLKITLALVACSASFAVMAQDKILVGVDTATPTNILSLSLIHI